MTTAPTDHDIAGGTRLTEGLNDRQREAVLHQDGPLIVLAGPGAGKTHMIVRRLARLVASVDDGGVGADPARVVALAYTVKAAEELRERVEKMVGADAAQKMFIGTSHSFGRRIVRRFGDSIGLPWRHHIADSAERISLLRALAREHDLLTSQAAGGLDSALHTALQFIQACHTDAVDPGRASEWIRERRERLESGASGLSPEDAAAERAKLVIDAEHVRLYELFERERLSRGMLSLDDYLLLPIRILRDCALPRDILRAEFRHVVVDEFQDWNPAQIRMLSLLCPPGVGGARGPDLCVVGDDDQSIYAFRGADDRAFERFAKEWPEHTQVALEINYRSDEAVIDAGNAIIERAESRFAPEKTIRVNPDCAADPSARVEGVLATVDADIGPIIAAMLRIDHEQTGRPLREYAVLARTHTDADRCAAALELEGVPVNRRRKRTPLDDQAVRDLLAWCGLLVDGSRTHDAQRVLVRPPIGADIRHVQQWASAFRRARHDGDTRTFVRWLLEGHADHDAVRRLAALLEKLESVAMTGTADEAMRAIIRDVDLAHAEPLDPIRRAMRIEDLIAVLRFVRARVDYIEPPGDLSAFLRHYEDLDERERAFEHAGDSRVDGGDEEHEDDAAGVVVLTAHAAKGLEFDTVFVARVRPQHGFPKTSSQGDDGRLLDDPTLTGRHPTSPIDEERRLFYVASTRAKRRLVLVAKKRKSKRSSSTDFFDELTQDALPEAIAVTDGDDWLAQASRSRPDAAGLEDEGARERDAWIDEQLALARQRASGTQLDAAAPDLDDERVRALCERAAQETRRIAALAYARARRDVAPFADPTDPLTDRLRDWLARRRREPMIVRPMTGPLTLSFSKLIEYQNCPRCYYVKYVLGLDEAKTQALSTGSVVHEAIERFLAEHRKAESDGEPLPGRGRLLEIGARAYRQAIPPSRVPDAGAAAQVSDLLGRFFDVFHDPDAELLIIEGQDADASEEDADRGVVRPFPYSTEAAPEVAHSIIAKPDRVERMTSGAFRIVDYKTGHASKKLLEPEKKDLQLAIYAMAVQRHFELDAPPQGVAEYWLLKTGERGVLDMGDIRWDKVRETIDAAIDGMLTGQFERGPERTCKRLCDLLDFGGQSSRGGDEE